MLENFFEDALFAAIAAIGFSAISNPPRKAYLYCAVIAAIGHSSRLFLMSPDFGNLNIILASTVAATIIGLLAVIMSPFIKIPAETFLFPSLLPMIPGIYAYKTFGGLVMCLLNSQEEYFNHYFYLFANNGLTCLFIILGMVIGASLPIFFLKQITFQATR